MKRVLITGVTGQDGSYLAELLAGKGLEVVGTSRSPAPSGRAEQGTISPRTLVLSDPEAVRQLITEVRPDRVFHLAGQSSVGQSFKEPALTVESIVTSTLNVLEAVRTVSPETRVFIASSGEAFGDTGDQRADEATCFRPLSPYAAAKAAAAELARAYRVSYSLFVSVGFLYNHESPRRPERFVTRKVVRAACEIALKQRDHVELGELGVIRDWGWAPEYVDAMARTLEASEPDDFVIATGRSESLERFVELVFAELGLNWRAHVKRREDLIRPAEARVLHANPARAEAKLGWKAKLGLTDVVHRLVEHERAALSEGNPHSRVP